VGLVISLSDAILKLKIPSPQIAIVSSSDKYVLFKKCTKTAGIRHQCKKKVVLSRHSYLINTGGEKMNNV